jgi:DNA-binding CsgD family transcriptional regulator
MTAWTLEQAQTGRSAEELSDLLHLVYGAASDSLQWPRVLEAVIASLKGRSGMLFTPQLPPHLGGILYTHNIPPEQNILWATKYIELDLWTNRAFERQLVKQGAVITDADTATEEELLATEIYQDLLSKMDVGRFCSGVIFDGAVSGLPAAALTTHRSLKAAPFSVQDRAWFKLIVPHLSRAMGLMFRLDNARLSSEALLAYLDKLPLGILLISQTGQIMHANNAGRGVLARQDGLTCGADGQLDACAVNAAQPRLAQWLAAQNSAVAVDVAHFADAYLAQRVGIDGVYSVQCCPIDASQAWQVQGQWVGAVVFVSDPAALVLPEASRLVDLYGFTPAQARVARELAKGKSTKEVARALDISPETVRTHTQDVYQKMRIHSQADLVRGILTLGHSSV